LGVAFLACVGAALVFGVAARSAGGPAPLAFGAAVEVGYALPADAGDDGAALAIGDLNGDRRPDIAIASDKASAVAVIFNRGGGRFRPGASYPLGADPAELARPGVVAIADVNGDGKQDLVATNEDADMVAVLLNRGDGTFRPRVAYPTGRTTFVDNMSLAVGDLNGDGKPDLVTANTYAKRVYVLLNKGDGTFGPSIAYPTGSPPFDVAIGDLNRDGRPDIVATDGRDHIAVMLNRGDGLFATRKDFATAGLPYSIVVADFNADGRLDVATGNGLDVRRGVSVLLNQGNGNLGAHHDFAGGATAAVDLNGDGKVDLASGGVFANLGHGNGTFSPELLYGPDNGAAVAFGDLNRDGRPDVVESTLDTRNGSWDLYMLANTLRACDVQPDRGRTVAAAAQALALANCRIGKIRRVHSRLKRGLVISQKPAFGAVLRKGARVELVVSLGRARFH
jgi:hypothetical protein